MCESLLELLKRSGKPGPFKPGVIVCQTTGDSSVFWENETSYGDTRYEAACGFTLYRAMSDDRVIGIRVFKQPGLTP